MNVSEVKTNQISSIVGTVAFFARSSAPTGWLKCNGAAISRTDYADLFDSIGTTYGTGDGSTTFNLPDLRGEFVRCWDDGRGVDKYPTYKGSNNGANYSNRTLDSNVQTHATANIWGELHLSVTRGECTAAYAFYETDRYAAEQAGSYRNASNFYFSSSRYTNATADQGSVFGGETRPRNVALLACIKY
jgi:microcystin-dependent protein